MTDRAEFWMKLLAVRTASKESERKYLNKSLDEEGGDDGEDNARDDLQEEAVEPFVDSEEAFIGNLEVEINT
jgi:hypothetical protein